MPAWIPYTLLRLALFGGVFALLWWLGVDYWLAAIFAAVIGLTVSYIFFAPLHSKVSDDIAANRRKSAARPDPQAGERGDDELAEDGDEHAPRN